MAKRCGRAVGLKKYRSRTKSGIWNQASENRPRRARPGRTGNLHASASSQADKTDRKSRFGTQKPENPGKYESGFPPGQNLWKDSL